MDAAFLLNGGDSANFLQTLMQSFRCTYICLWSYLPLPSNWLLFLDGLYHEENNQLPSSSSGSLAQSLYNEYRHSVIVLDHDDRVPGLAFKNSHPYIELNELSLQELASNEIQQQFYKEARIKIAVFMGCKSGEIELGWSIVPQINIEMEMKSWFPEDFSRQSPLTELPQLPPTSQNPNPNPPSSSSSSLRSLSMDSPESSSLLFNIPTTTTYIPEALNLKEVPFEQALKPISIPTTTANPHQLQAMQALIRVRNVQLQTLTSPSSPSSSHQPHQNLPQTRLGNPLAKGGSAFKNYKSTLAPRIQTKPNLRRQSTFNRAITYFRSLNLLRIQELKQGSRPTSTQLHHMISERKRREKLNESFQALRSLLPLGSKKDKTSVLTSTKEYLESLRAQVTALSRRNQILEAQLLPAAGEMAEEATAGGGASNERFEVRVSDILELNTEDHLWVDLRVTVRGQCRVVDMAIRILEFVKQIKNVSLVSMEANTHLAESTSIDRLNFRLKIEGSDWDKNAFREAVRRLIADLAL